MRFIPPPPGPEAKAKKGSKKSAKKGSKKGAKPASKTLSEILRELDKKDPPRPMHAVLGDLDEICEGLHEAKFLLDASFDDDYLATDRAVTFACLAERIIKNISDKMDDVSAELYKINRAHFLK